MNFAPRVLWYRCAEPSDSTMSADSDHDPPITVRVPVEWLERATALATMLANDRKVREFARPTRSMVARMALMRGIEVLEEEYTSKRKRKPKASKR